MTAQKSCKIAFSVRKQQKKKGLNAHNNEPSIFYAFPAYGGWMIDRGEKKKGEKVRSEIRQHKKRPKLCVHALRCRRLRRIERKLYNNEVESWKPQNQSPNLNPMRNNKSLQLVCCGSLNPADWPHGLIIIRIEFPSRCRISFKNEARRLERSARVFSWVSS